MSWLIGFIAAVVSLGVALVFSLVILHNSHQKHHISIANIWFVGVAVAAVSLFVPMYIRDFQGSGCGAFETALLSVHNMIRLFVVDCDFEFVKATVGEVYGWLGIAYSVLFSILYVVAPLLTFNFVLSFFQNFEAYKRFYTHYRADLYVFTAVNERSLTLAADINAHFPSAQAVFFSVNEEDVSSVQELGAIAFSKEIHDMDFFKHSKNSRVVFFALDEDETRNTTDALRLLDRYAARENTDLYVFSSQTEAGAMFSAPQGENTAAIAVKVRVVDENRSVVYRELYDNGQAIFEGAMKSDNGDAFIGAVVVGMDAIGTHMLKNLPWFCQMDGYKALVWGFSEQTGVADRLQVECPELFDKRCNGRFDDDGEAQYELAVFDGVNAQSPAFYDQLATLPFLTYVLISCGNDEKNLRLAMQIRSWCERRHLHPKITAVVRDAHKNEALRSMIDFKGNTYDIDCIADIRSCYSYRTILDNDVEQAALKRHLKWGTEDAFWRFAYNYNSSVASAIHHKMKVACGIEGADVTPQERSDAARQALRKLEHRRWNAYMRSQGYVFGEVRNDLAKTHPCLVTFEKLSLEDQSKDDD